MLLILFYLKVVSDHLQHTIIKMDSEHSVVWTEKSVLALRNNSSYLICLILFDSMKRKLWVCPHESQVHIFFFLMITEMELIVDDYSNSLYLHI